MLLIFSREDEDLEAGITDPDGKPVKEKSDASKTTQQSDSKDSQVQDNLIIMLSLRSIEADFVLSAMG